MTNIALDDKRGQPKPILDLTAEGIFGMDTEGICTFCNESALRMLGYDSQEDLVGKKHARSDTPYKKGRQHLPGKGMSHYAVLQKGERRLCR